jgi:hypothetical protein
MVAVTTAFACAVAMPKVWAYDAVVRVLPSVTSNFSAGGTAMPMAWPYDGRVMLFARSFILRKQP